MKDLTISPEVTIHQAMKVLNKTAKKCLFVIDENKKLLGTLTDGDLRRSILKGEDFSNTIALSYFQTPTVLFEGQYLIADAKRLMHERNLDLIPILDKNQKVVNYLNREKLFSGNEQAKPELDIIDMPVVIMAGGKGTRLEPFTKVLPKPLIPVNDKPIINHIIDRFLAVGVKEIYITINYKAKIIKAYFEELETNYKINFIEEKKPLGTAGSLGLIEENIENPIIVTNCDIIINADYSKIYDFHVKNNNSITLVASMKNYKIPYGTCQIGSDGNLDYIKEKPEYNFLVNTGMYIIDSKLLGNIPKNSFYHFTHFIEDVKKEGMNIGIYPITDDLWIDIGQWTEYKKAIEHL